MWNCKKKKKNVDGGFMGYELILFRTEQKLCFESTEEKITQLKNETESKKFCGQKA